MIETAVMLYQEVYRYAFARVKEKATAQEIAQNVMETVIRKIEGLEKEEALKQWVMSITTNKIRDYFRELKVSQKHMVQIVESDSAFWEQMEDMESDILELMEEKESGKNIVAALYQMETKYAEVIKAHVIYEKSFQQIADESGIAYSTIKTRYRRGPFLLKEKYLEIEEGRAMQNDRYDA